MSKTQSELIREENKEQRDDPRYLALDRVMDEYQHDPEALIPVLHRAQQLFGYLPKDVQSRIAKGLNLYLSEVYGVVSFYSLFTMEPQGQHRIGVCLGTACYVKGGNAIGEALEKQLGVHFEETTKDGQFSLAATRCIGACGLAPVVTVDEEVFGRLKPEELPKIIKRYREE